MITGQEFEVNRRVYVDFEGISLRRKFLTGLEPELINVMIGKLVFFVWHFFFLLAFLFLTLRGVKLIFGVHHVSTQVPYRLTSWVCWRSFQLAKGNCFLWGFSKFIFSLLIYLFRPSCSNKSYLQHGLKGTFVCDVISVSVGWMNCINMRFGPVSATCTVKFNLI